MVAKSIDFLSQDRRKTKELVAIRGKGGWFVEADRTDHTISEDSSAWK
ncbi:MAG: hypothetical protein NTW12_09810 [Deltaproteobacteria bacterium]|nr:hypothetical protein [Deltaproteobacteria bacterium]